MKGSSMRSAALTSMDFTGSEGVDVKDHPMNNPIAKEAPAHSQSTSNPMEQLKTTFKKPGNLGGLGHGGN
jgi:hypothetical protein